MNYKQILKNLGNIVLPINTFGFGFNSGSFLFFLYKSTNKRLGEETGCDWAENTVYSFV